MSNRLSRAVIRWLLTLTWPFRWVFSNLRARLLREPLLLFPLRIELKWDDHAVKLRLYPDGAQTRLVGLRASTAGGDGFGALRAFGESGLEILALPRRFALYTLGAYGGLQPLAEVAVKRDGLRLRPDLRPDSLDEDRDPSRRWLHDFNEAERVGMALTITDRVQREQLAEAEWLLVFGYDRTRPAPEVLGALIEERQLECINLHTPTNNTPGAPLSAPARHAEETTTRAAASSARSPGTPTSAGDALARYLRISAELVRKIPHHESLLDTELPHHARELLFPGRYRDLNPRGPLPLLRIGDSPYAIAPTSPSRWRYGRLPYALALARTHGRTIHENHEPAVSADEGLLRFDATTPQPLHSDGNAYERLQATLQHASRATSLRLVDKDGDVVTVVDAPLCPGCGATLAESATRCPECNKPVVTPRTTRFFLSAATPDARAEELRALLGKLRDIATGRASGEADPPPRIDDIERQRGEPLGRYLLRSIAREVQRRGDVEGYLHSLGVLEAACAPGGELSSDQLEAMLLEVLEAFSSRIDVWFMLRAVRRMIHKLVSPAAPATGAYGWVERPCQASGTAPRGKYLQAPSLAQGVAVAALGAVSDSQDSDVRINLSSRRVRVALGLIDAIRAGASIGEYLGQHAERLLRSEREERWTIILRAAARLPMADATVDDLQRVHRVTDKLAMALVEQRHTFVSWHDLLAVDGVDFAMLGLLRSHLELPCDRDMSSARPPRGVVLDGEYLEALNLEVLNEQIRNTACTSDLVIRARAYVTDDEDLRRSLTILRSVRDHIASIKDAFLDLVCAEIGYQQIRGNTARVNAWLAVAEGRALPPEPEVVCTRRSGCQLVHTAMVVFDEPPPGSTVASSVRARLEPSWDAFVTGMHRAALDSETVALRLSAWRTGQRSATWSFDTTASAQGIALVDLVVDGARCLERHKLRVLAETLAALRADPDQRRWRVLVTTLGFRDDDSIGTIASGVELELNLREADLVVRRRDDRAASAVLGPALRVAGPGIAAADLAALRALFGRVAARRLIDDLGFSDPAALDAAAAAFAIDVVLAGPAVVVTRVDQPDRSCAIRATARQLRRLLARSGDVHGVLERLRTSDPERWAAIASTLHVAPAASLEAISEQTCLDITAGATASEVRGLHDRLARLIRGAAPLIIDRNDPTEVRWLLSQVKSRIQGLHRASVGVAVPALITELDRYLRDPHQAAARGMLAGAIAPTQYADLLRAPDQPRFAEARDRLVTQLERWTKVCGKIATERTIVVCAATSSDEPLCTFRIVPAGPDGCDIAPDDLAIPGLAARVRDYLSDVTERLRAFLDAGAGQLHDTASDDDPTDTRTVRVTGTAGGPLFLPRITSQDGVIARLVGAGACALADGARRAVFHQLAKARFVRPGLAPLLCGRSPTELLAGYQVHGTQPPTGSAPLGRHATMTHVFHPLGAAPGATAVGFVVDCWTDFLPDPTESTALVVNYDAPQAEAPNALLLCAPALLWWSDAKVARSLANALDVARLRTLTATEIANSRLAADFTAQASCTLAT